MGVRSEQIGALYSSIPHLSIWRLTIINGVDFFVFFFFFFFFFFFLLLLLNTYCMKVTEDVFSCFLYVCYFYGSYLFLKEFSSLVQTADLRYYKPIDELHTRKLENTQSPVFSHQSTYSMAQVIFIRKTFP